MNGWDIFTWISSVVLAGSGLLIFVFFLRDARDMLKREKYEGDQE